MKKIISLILCAILVLGMAVNAFAATSFNPAPPNNPTRPAPVVPSEPDVIVIEIGEEDVNPNTGAPVFAVPAVIAAVAAAAVIGKRK